MTRYIEISEEITHETLSMFISKYYEIDHWCFKKKKYDKKIPLFLNSEGGCLDSALSIYHIIQNGLPQTKCKSPLQFHIQATSCVYSATICIFLASKNRSCFPTTSFMVHDINLETQTLDLKSFKSLFDVVKNQREVYKDILETNTKMSGDMFEGLLKQYNEYYFGYKDAINLNFVTGK